MNNKIADGTVHSVPTDMQKNLRAYPLALVAWVDITPLERNEWICWVESAKQTETRERRIRIMCENLSAGKRRPCCWAGCPHR